jgi:hypothetical protein
MSDDNDRANTTEATPNRGRRRDPATLEGESFAQKGLGPEPEAGAPKPSVTSSASPAAPREGLGLLSFLPAVAALLLAVASLYYTLVDDAPEPLPGASVETVAALGQRIERLEGQLAGLEARPVAPQGPRMTPQAPLDLGPLEQRLAAAEAKAESANAAALRAGERAEAAARQAAAAKPDLAPLDRRLAKLDADLAQARETLAAPKTELRATEAPNVAAPVSSDAAALAVVTASLLQKLDKGMPIGREIAALEAIGAAPADIAALRPLAQGAPTTARLAQEFSALSSALLRAVRPVSPDTDLLDRLARSASSLVRVRPVGEAAGEDAPALIARMESALQRGDIVDALSLFGRLPTEARDVARDWAQRARQRADAELAIRRMVDTSIERIAGK